MRARTIRLVVCATAILMAAVAGCSTGSQDTTDSGRAAGHTDRGAFPVTIQHGLGTTTIEQEPKRVATLGWGDQDAALALGVVPVGATKLTWGGNKKGSSDWFDHRLAREDGKQPARYDDSDGAPIDEIAELDPDVILASNSGITKQEYAKLSKIAKVVPYPDTPWTTRWQKSLKMVGQALGRSSRASDIRHRTDSAIASAKKKYPQIEGKSLIFGYLTATDLSSIGIYGPKDPRVSFMHDFGMTDAPAVTTAVKKGKFYQSVSAERAPRLKSDVFLTWSKKRGDMKKFAHNPLISKIPAIRSDHAYAEEDDAVSLAVTNPTPLSIPYAIKHFVPKVAQAVDGS